MTRGVNFPHVWSVYYDYPERTLAKLPSGDGKLPLQPAGKVSFCNLNLAIKKFRTNEKIVNFSVLYSAVS